MAICTAAGDFFARQGEQEYFAYCKETQRRMVEKDPLFGHIAIYQTRPNLKLPVYREIANPAGEVNGQDERRNTPPPAHYGENGGTVHIFVLSFFQHRRSGKFELEEVLFHDDLHI